MQPFFIRNTFLKGFYNNMYKLFCAMHAWSFS